MAKVVVSVRMDAEVRDSLKCFADHDRRTLGSYIESLLIGEQDRRVRGDLSLQDVMNDLGLILEKLDNPKAKKVIKEKSSPMDCELPEDLDESSWKNWIQHLHRCDVHLNQYRAQKHADKFAQYSEDYDVNMLVERLIDDGAMSVFIPNDWKKKETKRSWAA